LLKTGISGWK